MIVSIRLFIALPLIAIGIVGVVITEFAAWGITKLDLGDCINTVFGPE